MAPIATQDLNATAQLDTRKPERRRPDAGIYVPTVAFFDADEELDLTTTRNHAIRLARAGVKGIVTHGSNGEAAHLDHQERTQITAATREALDGAGFQNVPIIVGCGAHSTRETVKLCQEAKRSGGSYALVLPPSYFASILSSELLLNHYRKVADASPVPLLIYNFPAVQSGIDLTSDQIIELARHPNIVGVKLTCGNTGKLARVAAATVSEDFVTMGGSSDFLLQTLVTGGHGVIAGLANLAPKANVEAMRLYESGRMQEAQKIQAVLADGDWTAIKGGFVAVKIGLDRYFGYGGRPRSPCCLPEKAARTSVEEGFAKMMEVEQSFA